VLCICGTHSESIRKLLPGGKVGLFVADMRGSQSFMYSSQGRRYFGESQWAEFEVRACGVPCVLCVLPGACVCAYVRLVSELSS